MSDWAFITTLMAPTMITLLAITLYDDLHGKTGAQAASTIDIPATGKAASSARPDEEQFFSQRVFSSN